jgi:hypothetical protein
MGPVLSAFCDLWTIDPDGSPLARVTDTPHLDELPSWQPV